MEAKKVHLRKEAEQGIKTEVDHNGELLVELGGHKYPIDAEFLSDNRGRENISENYGHQGRTGSLYSPCAIKSEPIDKYDQPSNVQLQIPNIRPKNGLNLCTNPKIYSAERNTFNFNEPAQYSCSKFIKKETMTSPSPVTTDHAGISYYGCTSNHIYDSTGKCYNNEYDYQTIRSYSQTYAPTDYQDITTEYQMENAQQSQPDLAQGAVSQYSPSSFCHASFSNWSYNMQQMDVKMAASTPWSSSSAQGFCPQAQYNHHTGDTSRHFRKMKRGCRLWEFIRNLLLDPKSNPSLIRWENREEGTFKLMQSKTIAYMWGMKKGNRGMTYEKLSRAMRYYYKRQVFAPVLGKRLVYKFGPRAVGWKD